MTASGVYYNSLANNLPSLKAAKSELPSDEAGSPPPVSNKALVRTKAAGAAAVNASERGAIGKRGPDFAATGAVRAVPRVMRVWVLPWEDTDGDLHDQSYVYMTLDSGRWLVDHTRNAMQPRKVGGTALLHSDSSLEAMVDADPGKSGFSRELEKLSPAKPGSAN
jgi:conjugal transfer pilus assembly protein TraV